MNLYKVQDGKSKMGRYRKYNVDWLADIGPALRFCRAARQMSLREVADLTGTTAPTIQRIELGLRDTKLETLIQIGNWIAGLQKIEEESDE